ncbi:MAG: hypothetical protein KGH89_06795 [Thaumarchaeota archaeon]|nr:hypothetical protein [Nitrososphaerota archaeon]MDE1867617.1 hypothetical protein [Nitrososphaerota archaeon]
MKRSLAIFGVIMAVVITGLYIEVSQSARGLEFAGGGLGQVSASEIDVNLAVCNPSFVPVTVESIESDMHGISNDYGSLEMTGKTIQPYSQEKLQGTLSFVDFDAMKTFVDWTISNETGTDFNSTLLIKTKVLGLIPYSYEKNYNLEEFSNLVFGKGKWDCQLTQNYGDVKQQLMLVQARMSVAGLLYSGNIGMGDNSTKSINATNSTGNNQSSLGQ